MQGKAQKKVFKFEMKPVHGHYAGVGIGAHGAPQEPVASRVGQSGKYGK